MPKSSVETAITVINVLLWLGAISFLLWFVITETGRSKDSQYVTTSTSKEQFIQYPNMMICPSSDSAFKVPNTTKVTVGNGLTVFRENSFQDQVTSYYICPVTVKFQTRTGVNVECVNFQMNIQKNQLGYCDPNAQTGSWYQATNQIPPDHPWSAIDVQSFIQIILNTQGVTSFPLIVHFYSDKSLDAIPVNGDTGSYESLFSIGTPQRTLLPLGSTTAISMKKYVRDNYPDNTDCSYDSYDADAQIMNLTPETNFNASDSNDFATAYVSYDDLTSTKQCHRPVIGFGEVLGIVGGGIAIVLACTMLISKAVELCVKKTTGEREDKPYNTLQN